MGRLTRTLDRYSYKEEQRINHGWQVSLLQTVFAAALAFVAVPLLAEPKSRMEVLAILGMAVALLLFVEVWSRLRRRWISSGYYQIWTQGLMIAMAVVLVIIAAIAGWWETLRARLRRN